MKNNKVALVVTSISDPNNVLISLAKGCIKNDFNFWVIGDEKSPTDFELKGCNFISLEQQLVSGFEYAKLCPAGHYARKNIGYLYAIKNNAPIIIETDDDNLPYADFWGPKRRFHKAAYIDGMGWINVFRYFNDNIIWPRGFPLQEIKTDLPPFDTFDEEDEIDCPIQQGLADNNPDVDAIYRLSFSLSLSFKRDRKIAMGPRSWCPFNSQNTTWWPDVYPLLYLPAYCSFRMTDIWRGFVAQRIAWEYNWNILFHSPTVTQERNVHDLMKDFQDEIPGYLNNFQICDALEGLDLSSDINKIGDNLRICYEKIINMSLIQATELDLLDAWLHDLGAINIL